MKLTENRIDASLLTDKERDMLQPLLDMADGGPVPCLKGPDGTEIPIPVPIFEILVKVAQELRRGKSLIVTPMDETFTTQAAANFLGMSRQHFVTLIEGGKIPFHRVGSHRRVYYKDLKEYSVQRDTDRRTRLDGLFSRLSNENRYDSEAGEKR